MEQIRFPLHFHKLEDFPKASMFNEMKWFHLKFNSNLKNSFKNSVKIERLPLKIKFSLPLKFYLYYKVSFKIWLRFSSKVKIDEDLLNCNSFEISVKLKDFLQIVIKSKGFPLKVAINVHKM